MIQEIDGDYQRHAITSDERRELMEAVEKAETEGDAQGSLTSIDGGESHPRPGQPHQGVAGDIEEVSLCPANDS